MSNNGPADNTAKFFNFAQLVNPRRDPLTLDLDGDGLETVGVAAGVLFDHDGDGVMSGTGWVSGDDGFLVLDRNGNGVIDSGRELFGDSTPLASGGNALDGFSALAQEDTNADGRVDSLDANWGALRVWRDLNQDGVSQAGELFTLDSLGIAALDVGATEHIWTLPNGKQMADLGSYAAVFRQTRSAALIQRGKAQGFVATATTLSDQAAGTPVRLPATTPCALPVLTCCLGELSAGAVQT